MIRRYRVNKHSVNTGCAMFDTRDLRPIGSRLRMRLFLSGHYDQFDFCIFVFLVMPPRLKREQ